MGASCSSCCKKNNSQDGLYAPLLAENEREAVSVLLGYLENRTDVDFFSDGPLKALTTLVYSDNIDLQRSAALAFAEITEKDVRPVGKDTIEPILLLLQSNDVEVQRAASAALGNLAVNNENKVLIVQLGGLEPLIRQMGSPNVEVQCNAVGCITNLATNEASKAKIASSGALIPLTKLAKSKDLRVQRNATGALLNMTHSDENRQELVNAGTIPVLVSLLSSTDPDVQYYCTTALSNIAVDSTNRTKLAQTEPQLVQHLVELVSSSSSPRVQCQAALALRNLASDDNYQLEIVRSGGLPPLLRLLKSDQLPLVLSAVACIRNISIHPANESLIIEAGFLKPLVDILAHNDNEEVKCHAISTLRNLAASSESNKRAIVDAGVLETCKGLILKVPLSIQNEMTACIAVLALSDELKPRLMSMGIFDVLIPLTNSRNIDVQGNSAAALGNLSAKVDKYDEFVNHWKEPSGGISDYLVRFLTSGDITFEHIAVWTLLQLVDSGDKRLNDLVNQTPQIIQAVKKLSQRQQPSNNGKEPQHEHGEPDGDVETLTEVVLLAKKVLSILES